MLFHIYSESYSTSCEMLLDDMYLDEMHLDDY